MNHNVNPALSVVYMLMTSKVHQRALSSLWNKWYFCPDIISIPHIIISEKLDQGFLFGFEQELVSQCCLKKRAYLLFCNKRTSITALRRVQMSEGFEEQVGCPVPNRKTQRKKGGGTSCVEHQNAAETHRICLRVYTIGN